MGDERRVGAGLVRVGAAVGSVVVVAVVGVAEEAGDVAVEGPPARADRADCHREGLGGAVRPLPGEGAVGLEGVVVAGRRVLLHGARRLRRGGGEVRVDVVEDEAAQVVQDPGVGEGAAAAPEVGAGVPVVHRVVGDVEHHLRAGARWRLGVSGPAADPHLQAHVRRRPGYEDLLVEVLGPLAQLSDLPRERILVFVPCFLR